MSFVPARPSRPKVRSSSFQCSSDHMGTLYLEATESGDCTSPTKVANAFGSGMRQSATLNLRGTSATLSPPTDMVNAPV